MTDEEVELKLSGEDIRRLVVLQIEKDLELTRGELAEETSDWTSFSDLVHTVDKQIQCSKLSLDQILYKVDVDENAILDSIQSGQLDFQTNAAKLIIKRTLQKVVLRQLYS